MAMHVLSIELEKCIHQPGKKVIRSFSSSLGLTQVFDDLHGSHSGTKGSACSVYVGQYEADCTLTVGDVMSSVGTNNIRFVCEPSNNTYLCR